MTGTDHAFAVRVQRTPVKAARAYSRGQAFDVASQASLRESDPSPSAVEYLLGALGGDLVCGLEREAASRGLVLHRIEVALSGRLDNVLVHLGVIGENGHPGFSTIDGTAYVSTDADETLLRAAWSAALDRSPVFNTLNRCAAVTLALRISL